MWFTWFREAFINLNMLLKSDSAVRYLTAEEIAELHKINRRIMDIYNSAVERRDK